MTNISLEPIPKAGVVGTGRAGFPTHVKLARKANTVLINAGQCRRVRAPVA
jgi:Na+-translocating ferredoxin:NAD+ oxidoreductase RnfC subunit